MYWLCYHIVINYHASHHLKPDEVHVAHEPRNEYLCTKSGSLDDVTYLLAYLQSVEFVSIEGMQESTMVPLGIEPRTFCV